MTGLIMLHKIVIRDCKLIVDKKSFKISKGNQNLLIEKGQTTRWPIEKRQKDKQRSTKHHSEN